MIRYGFINYSVWYERQHVLCYICLDIFIQWNVLYLFQFRIPKPIPLRVKDGFSFRIINSKSILDDCLNRFSELKSGLFLLDSKICRPMERLSLTYEG